MGDSGDLVAEARKFLEENPDVTHLDPFIVDLGGKAVGKRYPASHIEKIYGGGTTFCAATYLLDVTGNSDDPLGYGFSDGDPDTDAWPVPGTLKRVPWGGGTGAQCLLAVKEADGATPLWFEPRVVLQKVVDRFVEMDLTPVIAVELEFYLIDNLPTPEGAPQPPVNPRTGLRENSINVFGLDVLEDFAPALEAINQACAVQGILSSSALSEYGAGQFEINLDHVNDPITAADQAAFLRRAVQFAVRDAGYNATFMSKPYPGRAGSGMHVHLSLLDEHGRNIFDPSLEQAAGRLDHVVAGFQAAMVESMGIFAPSINALRRYEPNQFVPVTKDWGDNNRSVAFRVPNSDDANRRIEHRIACADANPYLVIAAVLAAAHYGLVNELKPTEMAEGNAGSEADDSLPFTPWQAIDAVENAAILKQYFGSDYLRAYAEVKRSEFAGFLSEISAREYEWYL